MAARSILIVGSELAAPMIRDLKQQVGDQQKVNLVLKDRLAKLEAALAAVVADTSIK